MAIITSLGFSISSRFDGSGVRRARRSLRDLRGDLDRSQAGLRATAQGFNALRVAAVGLAPALVPLGAAATAVAGATVAMGAAAGTGLGAYAAAMKGAIQRAIEMDEKNKKLSGSQRKFINALNQTKDAYGRFLDRTQGKTLSVATDGLKAMQNVLRKMPQVINAFHPAIKRVSQAILNWTRDGGLQRFINVVNKYGVPAFNHLARAGRDVLAFLGEGFRAFAPLGVKVAKALRQGAAALRGWAEGGGFQRFINSVRENAPQIKAFFSALVGAIGNLATAFAGLGPLALGLTTNLLRIVAALPPSVLQAIIMAWMAWKAAVLANTVVTAIFITQYNILRGRTIATTVALVAQKVAMFAMRAATLAWAAAQWVLNAALTANPIALIIIAVAALVAAIVWVATKTTWFQTAWKYTWNAVKTAFAWVWNAIKVVASAIWNFLGSKWSWLLALLGPVGWLLALAGHWKTVWNVIKMVAVTVWNALKAAFFAVFNALKIAWRAITGALKTAWSATWNAIKAVAVTVWNWIKTAGRAVWIALKTVFTTTLNAMKTIWRTVWNAIKVAAQTVWNWLKTAARAVWTALKTAFRTGLNFIKNLWRSAWNVVRGIFGTAKNVVVQTAKNLWNIVKTAFRTGLNFVKNLWRSVWNFVRGFFGTAKNVVVTTAKNLWRIVKNAFKTGLNFVKNLWRSVWNFVRGFFGQAKNVVVSTAKNLWKAVRNAFKTGLNFVKNLWRSVWNFVRGFFGQAKNVVVSTAKNLWKAVRNAFKTGLNWVKNAWKSAWNFVRGIFGTAKNVVVSTAKNLWRILRNAFKAGLNWVKNIWKSVWNFVRGVFGQAKNVVVNTAQNLWNRIRDLFRAGSRWLRNTFWNPVKNFFTKTIPNAFDQAVDMLGKAWRAIKKAVRDPIQAVVNVVYNNGIVKLWNKVAGVFGADKLGEFHLPQFAKGGPVSGAGTGTSDSIMARLSHGEHVWTAKEVEAAGGHQVVAAMRSGVLGGQPVRAGTSSRSFEEGGFFEDIGDAIGDVAGGIGDALGDAFDFGKAVFDSVSGFAGDVLGKLAELTLGFIAPAINPLIQKAADAGKKIVKDIIPGSPGMESLVAGGGKHKGMIQKMADTIKKWIEANDVLPGGVGFVPFRKWRAGDGDRVSYKGHQFNRRTVEMIKKAEGLYGSGFSIFQGSYNKGVSASAGTHDGGGAVDLGPANNGVVGAMRASGFAAWARGAEFGSPSMSPHVHGIAVGDPTVSSSAAQQVRDFQNGKNGLANGGPDNYKPFGKWMKYVTQGGGGKGVQRWRGLALKAMKMAGLSTGQIGAFLALMDAESDGDPRAINLTDSNAAQGYDMASKGLMQVIGPTFRANHVPGTSWNIFDPLANMAAAARYIVRQYGGNVPGSPYGLGTPGALKGWHPVGERGTEMVKFRGGERVDPLENIVSQASTRDVTLTIPITVQGDLDREAVHEIENELAPMLTSMLEQKVGWRN